MYLLTWSRSIQIKTFSIYWKHVIVIERWHFTSMLLVWAKYAPQKASGHSRQGLFQAMNVKTGGVRGENIESWVQYQAPKNRVDLWKWKWHQSIVVPMQGWCDPWSIWWHYWLIKISTSMVEVNHNVSKKENTISVSGDSTLYKLWLESTHVYTFSQNIWQSVIS